MQPQVFNPSSNPLPINPPLNQLQTPLPIPQKSIQPILTTPKARFILLAYDGSDSSLHVLDRSFSNLFNQTDILTLVRVYTQQLFIEQQ